MYSIDTLEVVGYADVLTDSHIPSIVPPVFRSKEHQDRFLLPPFAIRGNMVCGAVVSNRAEFDFLIQTGRITGFVDHPIPGRINCTLWVDEWRKPHYERDTRAEKNLQKLSEQYYNEAETCIKEGEIDQAEQFCNKAISANGNHISSWAMKAGILLTRGQQDRADMLAETVTHLCSQTDFYRLAEQVTEALDDLKQDSISPMCGVAGMEYEEATRLFDSKELVELCIQKTSPISSPFTVTKVASGAA